MLFAQDLPSWKEQAADKDSSDRAKYQKLVARAKELEHLQTSNPEEFKKQYALLKSIENGGPDSLEAISTSTDIDKKQQEQRAWNEQNLKALLKKRSDEFVALAVTVDFVAQTTGEGRSRKFVRPD